MFGLIKIGIKAHCGKHRLHGIGQNRRATEPPAFQFTHTQKQAIANIQFGGDFCQGVLVDQIGTQTRQLAFGHVWKSQKQDFGHGVIQNGVADEFQALIVARAITTMCQSFMQQFDAVKAVTQFFLQTFNFLIALHRQTHDVSFFTVCWQRLKTAGCSCAACFRRNDWKYKPI